MINPQDILDSDIREWYNKQPKTVIEPVLVPVLPPAPFTNGRVHPPTILQLEVTKNCNLRCVMCHKGQVSGNFIRDDISDVALEQIKPIYPYLKHAILFGDGEPMLFRGFWDIVRDIRVAAPKCCIDFINNGTLMHEKNILKCFDYKVSSMGLSLGGATPEVHDKIRKGSSLLKIVENFMRLKSMKRARYSFEPYVNVNIVIMRSNFQQLPSFVDLCHDIGAHSVEFQNLIVTHPSMELEAVSDEEVRPYLEEAYDRANKLLGKKKDTKDLYWKVPFNLNKSNRGYCKMQQPWSTVYVQYNGTVAPDCHWWPSYYDIDNNYMGTLNSSTSILDIWNGDKYSALREDILAGNLQTQCRGCGLAGGIVSKFRNADTDHTNPRQEPPPPGKALRRDLAILGQDVFVSEFKSTEGIDSQLFQINISREPASEPDNVSSVSNTYSGFLGEVGQESFFVQHLAKLEHAPSASAIVDEHVARINKYNSSFDYTKFLDNMELAHKERYEKKLYLESMPLLLVCELENACNFRCISCQCKRNHHQKSALPESAIQKMINMVPTAEVFDFASTVEPFVSTRIVDFIKKVRSCNPLIFMRCYSNGQLLNDALINTLIGQQFDSLGISIHGTTPNGFRKFTQTGDLSKVQNKLLALRSEKKERNSEYPIVHIASQLNAYLNPYDLIQMAYQMGVLCVTFTNMIIFPEDERDFQLSKISAPECYGGVQSLNDILKKCSDFAKDNGMSMIHPTLEGVQDHNHICSRNDMKIYGHGLLCGLSYPDNACPISDPWYRLGVSVFNEVSPCCHHGPLLSFEGLSPQEARNHPTMQGLRKLLISGRMSPSCFCEKKMSIDKNEVLVGDAYKVLQDTFHERNDS